MKIYLVERSEYNYDEFDAFVMAANTPDEALAYLEHKYNSKESWIEWPDEGKKTIELIGTTDEYDAVTEILGSYHAG